MLAIRNFSTCKVKNGTDTFGAVQLRDCKIVTCGVGVSGHGVHTEGTHAFLLDLKCLWHKREEKFAVVHSSTRINKYKQKGERVDCNETGAQLRAQRPSGLQFFFGAIVISCRRLSSVTSVELYISRPIELPESYKSFVNDC